MTDHGGAASPRTEAGKRLWRAIADRLPSNHVLWDGIRAIEAEAAQEAPAPEGLRAEVEALRKVRALAAIVVRTAPSYSVEPESAMQRLRAALAATPSTPAEPPQGQRLVLKAGVLIDLDAPGRAEARPPEGLDTAALARDLSNIRRTLDDVRRGRLGHARSWAAQDVPVLDDWIRRLSAGGATKP